MRLKWEKPELISFSGTVAEDGKDVAFGQLICCAGSGEVGACATGTIACQGCNIGGNAEGGCGGGAGVV